MQELVGDAGHGSPDLEVNAFDQGIHGQEQVPGVPQEGRVVAGPLKTFPPEQPFEELEVSPLSAHLSPPKTDGRILARIHRRSMSPRVRESGRSTLRLWLSR